MKFSRFFEVLDICNYDIVIIDGKTGAMLPPVNKNTPPQDIVKYAIKERKSTQAKVAELAGYPSASNVGGLLNNNVTMQVANFTRMLGALDYSVVVVDRVTKDIFSEVDLPKDPKKPL